MTYQAYITSNGQPLQEHESDDLALSMNQGAITGLEAEDTEHGIWLVQGPLADAMWNAGGGTFTTENGQITITINTP